MHRSLFRTGEMRGFSLHRTYRVRIETARIMNAALTENRIFFLGIEGAPQNDE